MSIHVYKKNLLSRVTFDHAVSANLRNKYNGIGRMAIVLPADPDTAASVEVGGLVFDDFSNTAYTIQNVVYDNSKNEINLNGYTANWLLNLRVIAQEEKIASIPDDLILTVSGNLRGLYRVNEVSNDCRDWWEEDITLHGGQLLDSILPLLSEHELGNKMLWDDVKRSFDFHLTIGEDLTTGPKAVIFSEDRGTAPNLVMNMDESTFSNVFYLELKYSDDTVETVEWSQSPPEERREFWITEKISQKTDETKEQAKARAIQKCKEIAEDRLQRTSFDVNIDSKELGTLYNLGDKVTCVSERLGVSFNARITEVKYTIDKRGECASVILGEPQLTIIDEVRLKK